MKNITLISLADNIYYKYLKALVISATINFPQASLYIVLVNMEDKYKKEIESLGDNIKVEIEILDFPGDYEKKCYCAGRRVFLFKKLREETDDILLWVDADSIVRKSCYNLILHLNSCELTMRSKLSGRFASGVIGINSSDICEDFINQYYENMRNEKDWMSDQRNLNKTYLEFKDKIKFISLPNIYCDVWLSKPGVIWTAKSKNKKNKIYKQEMGKYV